MTGRQPKRQFFVIRLWILALLAVFSLTLGGTSAGLAQVTTVQPPGGTAQQPLTISEFHVLKQSIETALMKCFLNKTRSLKKRCECFKLYNQLLEKVRTSIRRVDNGPTKIYNRMGDALQGYLSELVKASRDLSAKASGRDPAKSLAEQCRQNPTPSLGQVGTIAPRRGRVGPGVRRHLRTPPAVSTPRPALPASPPRTTRLPRSR